MIATSRSDTPHAPTSAVGSMYRSGLKPTPVLELIVTTPRGTSTTNTYETPCRSERTATRPAGGIGHAPAESTAEAIMEIRRLSGLTWEELGNLFDVSRRSVHHWASGKPVSAKHDRMIHRMVVAVRHLDRGNRGGTRALLLAVDQATGLSTFDLLKDGRFSEAKGRVERVRVPEPHRVPLSDAAREARRPPAPTLLLEAEQERPDIPAKARVAPSKRTPKTAG